MPEAYADELFDEHYRGKKPRGMNIKKYLGFYKAIPIKDLPDYVPDFVRGATNLSKIWLKKGMDYLEKRWVLAHEIAHIKHPYIISEFIIDMLAPLYLPLADKTLRQGKREVALGYAFA